MARRSILLHYHIFKNAGSTIVSILRKNFSDSFQTIDEPSEHGCISSEAIIKHLTRHRHRHIKALSSHHFTDPRPDEQADLRFVDICFLRHPLDRLQSMYSYYKSIPDDIDKSLAAKRMTLPEFLLWMLEVEPYNTMNSQTAFMATGGKYFFPPSASAFEAACRRVEDVRFLGVVDRFDESLMAARFFLHPMFPDLDFTYSPVNVSGDYEMSLTEKLEKMKGLCGEAFFNRLRKVNEVDEKLWMYATEEVTRRFQYVPESQRTLAPKPEVR